MTQPNKSYLREGKVMAFLRYGQVLDWLEDMLPNGRRQARKLIELKVIKGTKLAGYTNYSSSQIERDVLSKLQTPPEEEAASEGKVKVERRK